MSDTMDYYASEELLVVGRGDSPALAVLDRNARSLAQRVADETKEELEKVLKRVENVRKKIISHVISKQLLENVRKFNFCF